MTPTHFALVAGVLLRFCGATDDDNSLTLLQQRARVLSDEDAGASQYGKGHFSHDSDGDKDEPLPTALEVCNEADVSYAEADQECQRLSQATEEGADPFIHESCIMDYCGSKGDSAVIDDEIEFEKHLAEDDEEGPGAEQTSLIAGSAAEDAIDEDAAEDAVDEDAAEYSIDEDAAASKSVKGRTGKGRTAKTKTITGPLRVYESKDKDKARYDWFVWQCVEPEGGAAGGVLREMPCQAGALSQQWTMAEGKDGLIRWAQDPTKCIDLKGGAFAVDADAVLRDCDWKADTQRWAWPLAGWDEITPIMSAKNGQYSVGASRYWLGNRVETPALIYSKTKFKASYIWPTKTNLECIMVYKKCYPYNN